MAKYSVRPVHCTVFCTLLTVAGNQLAAQNKSARDVCAPPWESLAADIQVSYLEVSRAVHDSSAVWTWCFKNTGARTVTQMNFQFVDALGQRADSMRTTLNHNQTFGGWAAFASRGYPSRMRITDIRYGAAVSHERALTSPPPRRYGRLYGEVQCLHGLASSDVPIAAMLSLETELTLPPNDF